MAKTRLPYPTKLCLVIMVYAICKSSLNVYMRRDGVMKESICKQAGRLRVQSPPSKNSLRIKIRPAWKARNSSRVRLQAR